ncbi:hypothetical protein DMH18_17995 [Streptomyces sp. WAC 06783]|uniref:hypothetical protein n=1 Tax=Streptomyces sp. WAC 06783 TaxID=2203211 RepID=UPI000F735502|nr:hypothetical protein [Streptomyces sp. WAC 06783]RSO09318.1 hypothetical protein DMH18_17995 [Streptomyces sp. WAC 06783]
MVQVEPVVVDLAQTVDRSGQKLSDPGGPCEAKNGAAAETEPGDGTQAAAAFDAFVDLLVALTRAGDEGTRPAVDVQLGLGGILEGVPVVLGAPNREGFAQVGAVSADNAFNSLGQVVQQNRLFVPPWPAPSPEWPCRRRAARPLDHDGALHSGSGTPA